MNCKPGDLAIAIRTKSNARVGAIVTVVRRINAISEGVRVDWEIEWQGRRYDCPDSWLRPIRPQAGEDETLSWAGKPREVETQ
jgi:hypothetical protein